MKLIPTIVRGAICIGAAFALTTTTADAANVLADPGFELGPATPWNTFNAAHADNTGPVLSGSWSLNEVTANNVPGAFQQFAAAPNDLWTMTGFGYTPSALLGQPFGGASFGGLQITFFDSANNNLGTVETSPGNAKFSNMIDQTSPAGQWLPLTVAAHAPAGTAYGQAFAITIDFGAPAPEGLYFDNLSLEITPVPEPSCLALAGLGALLLIRRRLN